MDASGLVSHKIYRLDPNETTNERNFYVPSSLMYREFFFFQFRVSNIALCGDSTTVFRRRRNQPSVPGDDAWRG